MLTFTGAWEAKFMHLKYKMPKLTQKELALIDSLNAPNNLHIRYLLQENPSWTNKKAKEYFEITRTMPGGPNHRNTRVSKGKTGTRVRHSGGSRKNNRRRR